ncbi:diguanylate cyclase [Candidatus Omnitrophota bacterium]
MKKKKNISKLHKKTILITDDEPEMRNILEELLTGAGYIVVKATNGLEALDAVKEENPDLILLDVNMPKMDGTEVKARLNKNPSSAAIPVIFVTGRGSSSDKIKGFNLGVDDYITKPFNLKELLVRVDATLSRRKFYEEISMTDGLTGLYNRHFFKKQFSLFFNLAKRHKEPVFSLAIIDMDKLKDINDTHGHQVGDFVLIKFASIMEKTLRKTDIITRYGGDEFTIIFPQNTEKEAIEAIARVKAKIIGKEFKYKDADIKVGFSISVGVSSYSKRFKDESAMFEVADNKMYKDKKKKR